ncbi:helix-turn-helix transcriptional regulator [Thalassotalea agariperforans]
MINKSKPPIEHYIEENRLVRKPEIQKLLGISRATLWRKIKSGNFIAPALVQNGRSVWLFKDVLRYMEILKQKRE